MKRWCNECKFSRDGDCEHVRTVGATMHWLPFEFEEGRREFGGRIWRPKVDAPEKFSRVGISYSHTLLELAGGLEGLRRFFEEDK